MRDYKEYINALRKCAKEHENDRTYTGHTIVSDLCRDTANLLERRMRTIDADIACEAIEKYRIEKDPSGSLMNEWDRGYNYGLERAKAEIQDLIVEAEPVKHGSWKPFDEDEYSCSECGNIFVTMDGGHPLSNGFKYCPFCGAKMA